MRQLGHQAAYPGPGADRERRLAILLVEDDARDAELLAAHLEDGGLTFDLRRVQTQEDFTRALAQTRYDIILSDYNVPGFEGTAALAAARLACPQTPFIFVSGALGEDRAIELLRRGATDYVLKDRLERLVTSVERALQEAREREERRAAEEQLRRSEERSRALISALAEGVILQDAGGHIREANASAQRLLGLGLEELAGLPFMDSRWQTINEDGSALPSHEHPAMVALRTGKAVIGRILGIHRPDGTLVWLSVNSQPLFDRDGKTPISVVSSFSDVSEQKRRVEFEQQLIGIVSHDLRNPLNAITMSASMMVRHENLDERCTRGARRILSSAERATRMIRDLLDFTQARLGGGIPVEVKPLELHEHAAQVLEELHHTHPERDLRLSREGDTRGEWDPDRLAQVVSNLVGNALKYSPPDTAVTLRTRGEGADVVLEVHNWGEPIAPERLPHLFKPLSRGTRADVQTRSIGLGLYIVDHIVRAHGGWVRVESSPSAGTTFTVRLPRVRGQRREEGAMPKSPGAGGAGFREGGP